MNSSDALVYFIEEDAVLALLPDWPAEMQVAVCLTSEGGCDMAVHHRSEVSCVLGRIAALYGWPLQDICVAPQMEGFQTRKVLFSEEQQLFTLVADSPHLVELAGEYANNYRHAQEQQVCADSIPASVEKTQIKVPQGLSAVPSGLEHHGSTLSPALDTANGQTPDFGLPSGYAAQQPQTRPECMFLDASLHCEGAAIRLILAPQDVTGDEEAVAVKNIGFRDDFKRFVMPLSVLEGWSPGTAALLDISTSLLPDALVSRFRNEPHHCEVTVTARGVFFSPGDPIRPESGDAGAAGHLAASRTGWRSFKPVHVAVGVLVAVMLVSGHLATARDTDPRQAAADYMTDSRADVALDLIAAMAQANSAR